GRGNRRVAGNGEDGIAVGTVVENPAAAAEDQVLLTGDVVRHAEARAHDDRRPGVAVLRDAVAGLDDAVERVPAACNRRPDRRLAIGRVGYHEELAGDGIHRIAEIRVVTRRRAVG